MSNPTYSLVNYGEMIADPIRTGRYVDALRTACRPGCTVLDLGAGPGMFAMLACRYGARHVYAIEPSDVIAVARELAQANGVADRITFIKDMSTNVTLPEPVDVVVTDVRGVLPMTGTSLSTMKDLRRFLAPGGVLIPERDSLHAALVDHASLYDSIAGPWRDHAYGLDTTIAARQAMETWRKATVPPDALLTPSIRLIVLDYMALATSSAEGSGSVTVERDGTAHGFAVWFETQLLGDIGFSNAPDQPTVLYRQAFFPLPQPVMVEAGDRASIRLRAHEVHDQYVWSWDTTLSTAAGDIKGRFSQSTFNAVPLTLESLRKADADATPSIAQAGEIDRYILDRLDGRTRLADIARGLAARFPQKFRDATSAMVQVTAIASIYAG